MKAARAKREAAAAEERSERADREHGLAKEHERHADELDPDVSR